MRWKWNHLWLLSTSKIIEIKNTNCSSYCSTCSCMFFSEPWLNSIGCLYAIVLRTNCVPSCIVWYMYMVTLRSTYLTWWCMCLNLPADLICAQRTRVLTTRREYAQRLVPDRFRLPPRTCTHGTNYLQTLARSPLFRLLNNTQDTSFQYCLLLLIFC